MTGAPLVSVLMPVYNREQYLGAALDSLVAQAYRPLEIVVVDDGSTDKSAAIARRYAEVRYEHQSHQGIAAARNRSLAAARGEYLAFLDSDDLWVDGALARQMEVVRSRPDVEMFFGHVVEFISPELDEEAARQLVCHSEPLPSRGLGAIIRSEAFRKVGSFRSQWRFGEFIDWQLRAMELGLTSLLLPDVVVRRRLHASNQGVAERGSRSEYLRILKSSLDRRRDDQH